MSIRVALVDTNPQGQTGSMSQYAEVVEEALAACGNDGIETIRLPLALPHKTLESMPAKFRNALHHLWIAQISRKRINKVPADLYHVLDGSHAYISRFLNGRPTVTTAHDIIPALQVAGALGGRRPSRPACLLIRKSLSALESADKVVADSGSTAADVASLTSVEQDAIHVVYPSLSPRLREKAQKLPLPHMEERSSFEDAFVLHVGHNGFYKNREGVLRIFAQIRASVSVRLKMAGPKPTAGMKRAMRDFGIWDYVDFITTPDTEDLAELYRHASLFLFPSIYEGFGWPPLEAMLFGCPVVASNSGSLREILGDATLSAESGDEKEIARLAVMVLCSGDIGRDLVRKGHSRVQEFSAEQMGIRLARVYRLALTEAGHPGISHRSTRLMSSA